MTTAQAAIWGIHGGKTGDADSLFLKQLFIGVGWHKAGDLSGLPDDREAFKGRLLEAYPEIKQGAVPVNAGQLCRFVHEMVVDDLVANPSAVDRLIHMGRVLGPYKCDPSLVSSDPHLRPVEWLKDIPRTSFTQGALYEIGAAMSPFQLKSCAEEPLGGRGEGGAHTRRVGPERRRGHSEHREEHPRLHSEAVFPRR